jgi:PleD family two-component response regulator
MVETTKFEFETNIIPVTISMGVTELQKSDTVEGFIGRADAKLYEGKQGGRNRVVA